MFFIELRMATFSLILIVLVANVFADNESSSIYKQLKDKLTTIIFDADVELNKHYGQNCVPESIYEFSIEEKAIWSDDNKANEYLNEYFDTFDDSLKNLDKSINIL